ncbi:V-type ATP synthase subunit A [Candidatus Peregrinibacteria bacterium]|nr:V-type ATP synthase subunit A [Candidatus Peregrinibacteria bacterium]
MEKQGIIIKVSGPLVVAKNMEGARMYEVVRVSEKKLIGEIIGINGDQVSIQVYEETSGVGPGEPVYPTHQTMQVELGPGLLQSIYDGIQRPLPLIEQEAGSYITRGIDVPGLDRKKKWKFSPIKKTGEKVEEGDIIGEVEETTLITHKIMVPPGMSGTLKDIKNGDFTIEEIVAVIEGDNDETYEITMLQKWPIRRSRPCKVKKVPNVPLVTGTRILDTLFPVAKGGAGCIPGPFGAGKTVTQQTLAKYCDAQIIVYIGCGERGNEMTDVLMEFPELEDPNTGEKLMKRTVMVANTSNMPVAAREASIYTGVTIAEYYRDMGYSVALMADSTSRWAEALREMSGRLEEMPGEEGYPAYLGSRTAEFYERSGIVKCLGSDDREGSLTLIGAVSPPGGDLSEPVTQNTLRVTKVFWGLDAKLAYRRHFPAINWLSSYTLYMDNLKDYWKNNISEEFLGVRTQAMSILQEEAKLEEIVRLVGMEALSPKERLTLETAKSLREDFLFQNAFDKVDAFTPLKKQFWILKSIIGVYNHALKVVENEDFNFDDLLKLPVMQKVAKCKEIPADDEERFKQLWDETERSILSLKI